MPQPAPQIIRITDPADPRLADYANLKDRQLAAMARPPTSASLTSSTDGLFMAEGELVVRQLIASTLPIKSILLTPTRLDTMRDAITLIPPDTPVYLVEQDLMSAIVGFHIHRGILAAGIRPPPTNPAQLLATAQTLLILEDLANHDNIGGIFRAAAAIGGPNNTSILLSPRCCDPLYRKSIRVSMGAALRVPFALLEPWPGALESVKSAGFTLIALTPNPPAADLSTLGPIALPAILLGSEGPGLSPEALAHANLRARIPIDPSMDSLNVVVAAAIALDRLVSR